MTISLNGTPHSCEGPLSVEALVDTLDLGPQPVLVELNGEAVLTRDFSRQLVEEGDVVEIVRMVAGG